MQCACAALYPHLWPVRLHNIFPRYLINGGKKSYVYWTVHHCNSRKMKDQLDVTCASARKTSTTQNQPHQISKTLRTENETTDVVIQQHSRKLLMMDILMSETCRAHKKWNKIASDIKLVFCSSKNILLNIKRVLWFTLYLLSGTFLFIITGRDIIMNVQYSTSVRMYSARCSCRALIKLEFSRHFI